MVKDDRSQHSEVTGRPHVEVTCPGCGWKLYGRYALNRSKCPSCGAKIPPNLGTVSQNVRSQT